MKILKTFIISFGLTLFIGGSAYGAIIHVPSDHPTIQEAIDAAVDGDTILVAPGTYEGFNFFGKKITVRSDADGDPSTKDTFPLGTIIVNTGVNFWSGEKKSSVLNGFSVEHGLQISQSRPTIINCIFFASECGDGCGIQVYRLGHPTIINSIFHNNHAFTEGAAADIERYSSATFLNCTFYGNSADNNGAAVHCESHSSVRLINCVFWENTAPQGHEIAVETHSEATVSYCNVQGGLQDVFVDGTSTIYWDSGTNINSDPLFVDPAGEDFHLQYGSPCIDAGTPEGAPNYDIDGDVRPQGLGYDIGADEFVQALRGCVSLDGTAIPNRRVILKQPDEPKQRTKTDDSSCYRFPTVVSGKTFKVIIKGPIVPSDYTGGVRGDIKLKGAPVVKRRVILRQVDEPRQRTKTDADGRFQFPTVTPDKKFKVIIKGPVVP